MPRQLDELQNCSLLGNQGVKYPTSYAPEMLETFKNKHPENEYIVSFDCPELLHSARRRVSPTSGISL